MSAVDLAGYWAIEDVENEGEFLKKIFQTDGVHPTEEEVSSFQIISITENYFTTELVSIQQTKRGERKSFSRFDPNFYTPGAIITQDDGTVVITDNEIIKLSSTVEETDADSENLKTLKGSEFFRYTEHIDKPSLMLISVKGVFVHNNNVYIKIQTLSEKYHIKVGRVPKDELKQDKELKSKVDKFSEIAVTRTISPAGEDGKRRMKIEMSCNGQTAIITATTHVPGKS